MPDAELAVKIGDDWVPLSQCDWVFTYPCGCPHSVLTAARGTGAVTATEDEAWRELWDSKREIDAAKKRGDVCELITHDRWKTEFYDRFTGGHACEFGPVDRSGEIPGQLDLIDELAKVSV